MNIRLLAFSLLGIILLLIGSCDNQISDTKEETEIKMIQKPFVYSNSKEKPDDSLKESGSSPYYCLVSTLNPEEEKWAYRYQRYDLEIPTGLLKQALEEGSKSKWVTYRFGEEDAVHRTEADTMEHGALVRMARCYLPASIEIVKKIEQQLKKFKKDSWVYQYKTKPGKNAQNTSSNTSGHQKSDLVCATYIDYFICDEPNVSDPYNDSGCTYIGSYCAEYIYVEGPGSGGGGSPGDGGDPCEPCEPDMPCENTGGAGSTPEGCQPPGGGGAGGGIASSFTGSITVDETITNNDLTDCVYGKLAQSNIFKDLIAKFEGGDSNFNLKFELAETEDNSFGELDGVPPNNFVVKIDASWVTIRNGIEIASTFLHESMHAEMRRYLYDQQQNGSTIPGFPGSFTEDWNNYVAEKFGTDPANIGPAEHEVMAEYFIEFLADGLEEFDNGQLDRLHYEALAWDGLVNTDAWDNADQSQIGLYRNDDAIENRPQQCSQ